ncbi:MAG TPA: hypothetical protein VN937_23480 [Blastocatellia bacterium]|nr:hypothetical protein [Blastocatellia bacterium]
MRIVRTIGTLVLAALLAAAVAAQVKKPQPSGVAPTGDAPALMIESFTHDFGEVKAGTPLRYAFKVRNVGKADLLINSVAPG